MISMTAACRRRKTLRSFEIQPHLNFLHGLLNLGFATDRICKSRWNRCCQNPSHVPTGEWPGASTRLARALLHTRAASPLACKPAMLRSIPAYRLQRKSIVHVADLLSLATHFDDEILELQ